MNMKVLMKDVHENAVAHGWWNEPREDATVLMLIVSEIDEAGNSVNEVSEKIPPILQKYEELADTCIRILDFLQYKSVDYDALPCRLYPIKVSMWHKTSDRLKAYKLLVGIVVKAMESMRNGEDTHAYAYLKGICETLISNKNVEEAIALKHQYNINRPYRHGNKKF